MSTETELKLAIDPAAVPALLRHPALRVLRIGRMRTIRLLAHYYDTADTLLAREGVAVRVRREGARWVQALKGPAQPASGAGLNVRGEWEWSVPGARLDTALLADTPWRKLIAKAARRGGLARRFTTEFLRRTLPLALPDGTRASLCVDQGQIRAVREGRVRRAPISEVEIELASGDAANLFRLALALAADLPLAVATESKAARGYALCRGADLVADAPVHAARVALAAAATISEALALVARECSHQIAANASGLGADNDPEWIHQTRVGTRRLRACLALVARIAPSAPLEELRAEVKWLAQSLGPARDWDVMASETFSPLAASLAHDTTVAQGIARVRARVAARRRVARSKARAAIASSRFPRLLLATGLLCAEPRFGAEPFTDPTGERQDPALRRADAFAMELLDRRHRKLLERGTALQSASPDARHELRIAAKHLRYAAEFFAPLFARRRARDYLETLGELQDVLGELNDAVTAAALAAEVAGTADETMAGAIRGWSAARGAALAPRLAKAWRRYESARPFWR